MTADETADDADGKGADARALEDLERRFALRPVAPVERWNPPYCGEIGMRIARDGSWHYLGSPIRRPALVRLFSTILRKDPERYVLVTPAECVGISVEDAPFVSAEMETAGEGASRTLSFRTNVGDWTTADADHPLRFERDETGGVKPYVLVRGGLFALLTRALAIDLVALCETRPHEGEDKFGVVSAGAFFPLARADELADIEAKL